MTPRSLPESPLKLLFVCSRNRRRSLTAEKLLEGMPGCAVRSAGTQPEARIVLTAGHIGWADIVFFMEKSHRNRAMLKHADALSGKRTICLHIADDYEFMEPALLDELRAKLAAYIPGV